MNVMTHAGATRTTDVAMRGVYEVAKLFSTVPSPRVALPQVVNLLCHFLELQDAAVGLCEGELGLAVFSAGNDQHGSHTRLSAILREACRGRRLDTPWIVESEWCEPLFKLSCDETALDRSFVSVPIRYQGRLNGVLCIERSHGPGDQADFCFDADVQLLGIIANIIATAQRSAEPPACHEPAPRPCRDLGDADQASAVESVEEARAIGESPRWRSTLQRARASARSSSTVLLRGESGTGKEVLARFIHEMSPRRERPFVSLNCAALPEQLLESELFGHERGAFTGALSQRKGRFELAHGGTLFLDEIGEISGAFQARLLRVLQLGEFERVGGMATLKVDVRLIAATNRDLEREVRRGRFRADLYYRLNVVPVLLPALRERASDIPALAQAFLGQFNAKNGTHYRLHPGALSVLMSYAFPGNVRELENSICRAATLAGGSLLTADDFAWMRQPGAGGGAALEEADLGDEVAHSGDVLEHGDGGEHTDHGARERLLAAMERAGWVQAKAARLLGLTPRQIAYALHKHRIPLRRL